MKLRVIVISAALSLGFADPGRADTSATLNREASRMNALASTQGETKVVDKISGEFGSFLGSDAKAVVLGLRNGTPINLTTTAPGNGPGVPPVTTTTIIDPPTGKMGFGNVFTSLALAKQQLGELGITQPTPQQLQAALTGGTITSDAGSTGSSTTLQGILTMRSEKMGWGQIAQKLGYKLGPVVSGLKRTNENMTVATSSSKESGAIRNGGRATDSSRSGIVSAGGKAHGHSGKGISGKEVTGDGIVTGSGKSAIGGGYGMGHGKGIVTGGGGAAGGAASGITSASGSRGNSGLAKGHNK